MDELNQKINQYYGQPTKRYLMRWGMRFQVYNKDVYGKPQYVPFEDTMLPIPAKPVDYLIYQYGIDWLMIPRENEVEVHDTIRDMERGYKDYMNDYMPLIDKEQALEECLQYKISEMEILDYNKDYHRHIYGTAAKAAAALLHKKLERMQLNLAEAFAHITPQADKLFDELFSDYLAKQLHQWYMFYQVFVPVEDEVIACVVSYLLRSGKCRMAEKLVNIRTLQKRPLSPEMEKAVRSYQLLAESSCLFWTGKHAEAVELIRSTPDVDLAPTEIAFCQFEELKSCTSDTLPAFRTALETNLRLFPQEDLFKLIQVDLLLRVSDRSHAALVAGDLLKNSCHGMVLQMLRAGNAYQEIISSPSAENAAE
jgi:lipopolysaccharide cholinephosphotransferase